MTSTQQQEGSYYERPSDQEILEFERKLKEEQTGSQPLIGPLKGFDGLAAEYEHATATIYQDKIAQLASSHGRMRSVKKDGNCLMRAFAFRFIESVVSGQVAEDYRQRVNAKVEAAKTLLIDAGYDKLVTEDWGDIVDDALRLGDRQDAVDALEELFNAEHLSDAIVCYFRFIVGAFLKLNAEMYEPFIMDRYPSMTEFIASQVEPMWVESDQIHIVALANAFGLGIDVADMDQSAADLNYHNITPMMEAVLDSQPNISLLYRPGHYDIVYKKGV